MRRVTLARDGDLPLSFEGEEIAAASSEDARKPRWSEYVLYRTRSGTWVLSSSGCSRLPGEVVKHRAKVCLTPEAVVTALQRNGDGYAYLPDVAMALLGRAAEADPRLAAVAVEEVR